jgi:hypothetical protein
VIKLIIITKKTSFLLIYNKYAFQSIDLKHEKPLPDPLPRRGGNTVQFGKDFVKGKLIIYIKQKLTLFSYTAHCLRFNEYYLKFVA